MPPPPAVKDSAARHAGNKDSKDRLRLDNRPNHRHFQSVEAHLPGQAVKPNIIIPYPAGEDGFAECGDRAAYAMAYVRPETNNVLYERAILSGLRAYGKIIYCANLSGSVFLRDAILERHYSTQLAFARDPRGELSRYPEIRSRVEEHFSIRLDDARVLGAFEALAALGMSEKGLLETIVKEPDYLGCWGQSFKRIDGAIVVNPNMPAIFKLHEPSVNVFSVIVQSRESSGAFFEGVNEAIFKALTSRAETPLLDGEKLDSLVWSERIRRTYHLSTNHLMAMCDMADFVYTGETTRLDVAETPLGKWLVERGGATAGHLRELKSARLARRKGAALVYLPTAGRGMSLDQVRKLVADLRPASAGDGQGTAPAGPQG